MPRYFFDTADGRAFHDPDGTILADFPAAQLEAVQILCQLLPGHEIGALGEKGFAVKVLDEARRLLMTLQVSVELSEMEPADGEDGRA